MYKSRRNEAFTMLQESARNISEQVKKVKEWLTNEIKAKMPSDFNSGGTLFTIQKFSDIQHSVWNPVFYLTGKQLQYVIDYINDRPERSLDIIVRTLQEIVETGRSASFRDIQFNDESREILAGLM